MGNSFKYLYIFIFLFSCMPLISQQDSTLCIAFDFNDHEIKENNNRIQIYPQGLSLVEDRFGNDRSAIYLHGNPDSYLNLGSSNLLKPRYGSISIWINLDRYIYAGKGYMANPIGGAKNGPGEDFINAYGMYYDFGSKRLCAVSDKDSTDELNIKSENEIMFNRWYHLVFVFGKSTFSFYIDGKLQQSTPKNFEIKYLENGTVIFGNAGSEKNNRWMQGMLDDLRIYHRALTPAEVTALYNEPDPNKTRLMIMEIAKYLGIVLVFVLIIIGILIQNRRRLRKQKEQFELQNRINELEIKVIKNQMNPHFISNCLSAIQELIYTENYKKATQYIAKFSFFLRQVLKYSDKTYVTLSEELTLIRLNVELEQLRFKEEFEFKLYIDDTIKLNEILIPSMITQPFIENSIWHGLLPLEHKRKAILKIIIYERNDSVFVEIEDNGVGRKLPGGIYGEDSRGTKLVMDKLDSINKLLNANDYRLEIMDLKDSSGNPSGTKIILQLKNNED